MEASYINWIQRITVYETASHIYLVGSDVKEQTFRLIKIDRVPVPLSDDVSPLPLAFMDSERFIEAETLADRLWRLNIHEDPHTYDKHELACLLHTIQASNRSNQTNKSSSGDEKLHETSTSKWLNLGSLFGKRRTLHSPGEKLACISISNSVNEFSGMYSANDLQQAAALSLHSGTGERSLVLTMKCYGVVGVVRFLRGYYLILITKCSTVAQLGEHLIYKIEDTELLYIPGEQVNEAKLMQHNNLCRSTTGTTANVPSNLHSEELNVNSSTFDSQQCFFSQLIKNSGNCKKLAADELRFVKQFTSVDLSSNFYFSYTYDLSHTMQYNLEPVFAETKPKDGFMWAVRSMPNSRFVWNWRLIPLKFLPICKGNLFTKSFEVNDQPDWFVLLYHGSINQIALKACGMPVMVTLIARRSRHFAGRRFLKRGINMSGDVANEVETEQIVNETAYAFLRHNRVTSYVQMRGSVPLFWSQESGKVVVGRPPLEILRNDPYFEAMGSHFASLFERFGSPLIILNLMKCREKRPFELLLSHGFESGIVYLNQFLPSKISKTVNVVNSLIPEPIHTNPPIIYISFDIARVQKLKHAMVLDELSPIVDNCIKRTGIYFSASSLTNDNRHSFTYNSKQYGIIRTNCVDCLDRTNTTQFAIGRVVLCYQLYGLGFLLEPNYPDDSKIDHLLQDLYDEHGDTLALQYGGSQLVHNIDTYRKIKKLTSHSRDLMQTISRYYSNKFSDWEKQCAINVFLRVHRPNLWPNTIFQYVQNQLCTYVHRLQPLDMNQHEYVHHRHKSKADDVSTINELSPLLDKLLISIATANAGAISDLSSDNYLHWLESWSDLPVFRPPFTEWCSWVLLQSLPGGSAMQNRSQDCRLRCIELPIDDIRVDWFSDYYQPSYYVAFQSLFIPQTRLIGSITPNVQFFDQMHTQRGSAAAAAMPHSSNVPPDPTNMDRAVKKANNQGVDRRKSKSSYVHITSKDFHYKKKQKKQSQQITDSMIKVEMKSSMDGLDTSSDSDSVDSVDTIITYFPLTLGQFPNEDSSDCRLFSNCKNVRQVIKWCNESSSSPTVPSGMNAKRKLSRSLSHQVPISKVVNHVFVVDNFLNPLTNLSDYPVSCNKGTNLVSIPEKRVYENYFAIHKDDGACPLQGANPKPYVYIPKPINQTSMDIYTNYVQMNTTYPNEILDESLQTYRATANLCHQLKC